MNNMVELKNYELLLKDIDREGAGIEDCVDAILGFVKEIDKAIGHMHMRLTELEVKLLDDVSEKNG